MAAVEKMPPLSKSRSLAAARDDGSRPPGAPAEAAQHEKSRSHGSQAKTAGLGRGRAAGLDPELIISRDGIALFLKRIHSDGLIAGLHQLVLIRGSSLELKNTGHTGFSQLELSDDLIAGRVDHLIGIGLIGFGERVIAGDFVPSLLQLELSGDLEFQGDLQLRV